jgi:hypothetical protein
VIKYAWKYDDGSYYAWCSSWGFHCRSIEAAHLTDTIEEWASCTAEGKPVMIDVFGELKYPWNPTRREII